VERIEIVQYLLILSHLGRGVSLNMLPQMLAKEVFLQIIPMYQLLAKGIRTSS
jgi:hypothetical protein